MVDVSDRVGLPTRIYDLLLALAGRLDDDALTDAREFLAVAAPARAVELTLGSLVAGGVPVTNAERVELGWLAERLLLDERLLQRLTVAETSPAAHRFTGGVLGDPAPEEGVADAAGDVLRALPDVRNLWCVWRTTPAGAIPGPVPQRVVLVELGAAGYPAATAYRVEQALRVAGVRGVVEVLRADAAVPAYHEAALGEARAVSLRGLSRGGRRRAAEPSVDAPEDTAAAEPVEPVHRPETEVPGRSAVRLTGPPQSEPIQPEPFAARDVEPGGPTPYAESPMGQTTGTSFGSPADFSGAPPAVQPAAAAPERTFAPVEPVAHPAVEPAPEFSEPRFDVAAYDAPRYETSLTDMPQAETSQAETSPGTAAPGSSLHEAPRFEPTQQDVAPYEAPRFEPVQRDVPRYDSQPQQDNHAHYDNHSRFDSQPQYENQSQRHEPPRYEAPQFDVRRPDAPRYEIPQPEARPYETPKYETPKYEAPQFEAPQFETPQYQAPKQEPHSFGAPSYDGPSMPAPAEPAGPIEREPVNGHARQTADAGPMEQPVTEHGFGGPTGFSPPGSAPREVPPESASEATFVTPRVPSYDPPPQDRQVPPAPPAEHGWRVQRPGEAREPVAESRPMAPPPNPVHPAGATPPSPPPERPQAPPRMPMHIPGEAGLNERELGLLRQLHEELSRREQAERAANSTGGGSWMAAGEQQGHGGAQNGHHVNGSTHQQGGGY